MSQVNRYANKAAYEADASRLKTRSAVSYVENDGEVIYDGVNVVVGRDAADAGDLAVFDKTDSTLKFVKGATLLYDQLPPELVPMAVAYGRRGDKVRIVALRHLDFYKWAVAYEVKLSGFDLSSGGSFTLHIYTSDFEFTYPAGATLASIAAQINANSDITNTYSWKATASDELNAIVMECNAWSTTEGHKKISASGCTLTKHAEDVDYQTTTAIIPQKTTVNVRRRNGADSQLAGCDNEVFLEYYRENGTTGTNILPGSSAIIRESVFTEADNPALVCGLSDLPGLSFRGALGPISVGLRGISAGRQKQYGSPRRENKDRLLRQECSVLSGRCRSCGLWNAGRGDDYRAGSGCMVAAVGRGAVADGQRSLIRAALRSGQSDIVRVGESDRQGGLHVLVLRAEQSLLL